MNALLIKKRCICHFIFNKLILLAIGLSDVTQEPYGCIQKFIADDFISEFA